MPDKDRVITIITQFLFVKWGNSKYKVETSVNLTSKNNYNADQAGSIFIYAKLSYPQIWCQMHYSDFKIN